MKIAICSAAPEEGRRLEDFILRYYAGRGEAPVMVRRFESRYALRCGMLRERFHILVVALDGMDGMEAAIDARKKDGEVCLIWISDMAQLGLQAFRLRAVDFLLKPLEVEALGESLARCAWEAAGEGEAGPRPQKGVRPLA